MTKKKNKRPLMVSVDWDFFIWSGEYSKIKIWPGDPEKEDEIPGLMLFDWSHSEGNGHLLNSIFWKDRVEHFRRVGLDIEKVVAIDPLRGCTLPHNFAANIGRMLDMRSMVTMYSDSHALAYLTARHISAIPGPRPKLLLFDAHCDLGYNPAKVQWEREQEKIDCGSWAYHVLRDGLVDSVEIVYPDWLGLEEWRGSKSWTHLDEVKGRYRKTTWSKWLDKSKRGYGPVLYTHIARSSNWTPPWLDEDFEKFVAKFPGDPKICMDGNANYPKIGAYNASVRREWPLL